MQKPPSPLSQDDFDSQLIATCTWSLQEALRRLDAADIILTVSDSRAVAARINEHLLSWQHLAGRSQAKGVRLWKLRPKSHYLWHIAATTQESRINPRFLMSCMQEESFLGYIKRIGCSCHSASLMPRLMARYLLYLGHRFQKTREGSRGRR